MQLGAVLVVGDGIHAALLGDLDVAHHDTLQAELPANEFLDQRRSLFGKVLLDAAVTAAVALEALFIGCGGLLSRSVEHGIVAVAAQLVELLAGDDIQPGVPDDIAALVIVGLDVVSGDADHELQTFQLVVIFPFGEAVQQNADNLLTVGQVDVSDLALTAGHRSGVDDIALCDVAADSLGELAVNIDVLHCGTLLSFWPYSDKIEGGRGKAPGSPLFRC